MKNILTATMFLILAMQLFAAKPIIDVPELPTGETREYYEDTEELFAMKLLEYYRASVWLESQLLVYGEQLNREVPFPTYDEISDGEFSTIEKYYKIAKILEQKVEELPEVPVNNQIYELRDKLRDSENSRIKLDHENYMLNLDNQHKEYYRENMFDLIARADSLTYLADSLVYENQKMVSYTDNFRGRYFLSVAATGNYLLYRDSRINADISPGVSANVHASQILGYGPYIDFWFSYISPQLNTEFEAPDGSEYVNYEWNHELYSTGLTGTIPSIIEFSDFETALKLGFGFYWGKGRIPNVTVNSTRSNGSMLYFELNTSKSGNGFPVELFVAYSIYFQSDKMNFNIPGHAFELSNSVFDNISFGLRFKFWGQ